MLTKAFVHQIITAMRKMAENMLHLAPQNVSDLVIIVAACLWVIILILLLRDIKQHDKSTLWKCFWSCIVLLPGFGGCLYALAELMRADWRAAFSLRH